MKKYLPIVFILAAILLLNVTFTLVSAANTFANICGVLLPIFVGIVTYETKFFTQFNLFKKKNK